MNFFDSLKGHINKGIYDFKKANGYILNNTHEALQKRIKSEIDSEFTTMEHFPEYTFSDEFIKQLRESYTCNFIEKHPYLTIQGNKIIFNRGNSPFVNKSNNLSAYLLRDKIKDSFRDITDILAMADATYLSENSDILKEMVDVIREDSKVLASISPACLHTRQILQRNLENAKQLEIDRSFICSTAQKYVEHHNQCISDIEKDTEIIDIDDISEQEQ